MLKLRDSHIKARGDDFTEKTYINKIYPTLRCSDPEYETLYTIKLIFLREENDYLLQHNGEIKQLLTKYYKLKILYRMISSWMKHFLYDAAVDFDMFSMYEIQLLFLDFLKHNKVITDDLNEMTKEFMHADPS